MSADMHETLYAWEPVDASEKRLQKALLKRFGLNDTWQDIWDWCTDPQAAKPVTRKMRSYGYTVLRESYDGLGLRLTRFREEVPGVGFVTLVALTKQIARRRNEGET